MPAKEPITETIARAMWEARGYKPEAWDEMVALANAHPDTGWEDDVVRVRAEAAAAWAAARAALEAVPVELLREAMAEQALRTDISIDAAADAMAIEVRAALLAGVEEGDRG